MEPFIGQIQAFGFNFPPRGWARCDGQLLSISQYTALFSLLGTTYGGDGRTTFALPDLRSRSIVHPGAGNGLDTVTWGQKGGYFEHELSPNQMPTHSHTHNISAKEEANTDDPNGNFIAGSGELRFGTSSDVSLNGTPTGNTGGNLPFSIRNPYIGIYTCIAVAGIFPPRN